MATHMIQKEVGGIQAQGDWRHFCQGAEQVSHSMVDKCLGVVASLPLQVLWGTGLHCRKGTVTENWPSCFPWSMAFSRDVVSQETKCFFIVQNYFKHGRASASLDQPVILVTKKTPHIPKCLNHPRLSTTAKRLRAQPAKAELLLGSTFDVDSVISGD